METTVWSDLFWLLIDALGNILLGVGSTKLYFRLRKSIPKGGLGLLLASIVLNLISIIF